MNMKKWLAAAFACSALMLGACGGQSSNTGAAASADNSNKVYRVAMNAEFAPFESLDSSNQVPDGDTLGRFQNILIHNGLQEQLFAQGVKLLQQKGLLLKKGTIVDSTIIAALSTPGT